MLVKAVRLHPTQGEKQHPPLLNKRDLIVMRRAGGKHSRVNDIYLVPIIPLFLSSLQGWSFALLHVSAAAPPRLQPLAWLCKGFSPHANSPRGWDPSGSSGRISAMEGA